MKTVTFWDVGFRSWGVDVGGVQHTLTYLGKGKSANCNNISLKNDVSSRDVRFTTRVDPNGVARVIRIEANELFTQDEVEFIRLRGKVLVSKRLVRA